MNSKILINQLELAYSPICNYDFNILKHDSIVKEILKESNLYIITQRPVISFENIIPDEEKQEIYFEIQQKSNPNVLKVRLPYFQEFIATNPNKDVLFYMGSIDANNDFNRRPISNVHGIKFYEEERFLIWFSPEKFLQNYWKGYIKAEIEGNIRDFTNYNVHYVGKATEQDIWKRLTGHASLQEILSLEYPLTYGDLPTHEITILFMKFKDNIQMHSWDGDDSFKDEMIDSLLGTNMPEQKTIFLDAEKALIKAMEPKYNKEPYANYPKSKDGLYKHNYNSFSYSFIDPITLKYDVNEIKGGLHYMGGDTIFVKDNKIIEVNKYKN